jgi:hypothetical protein
VTSSALIADVSREVTEVWGSVLILLPWFCALRRFFIKDYRAQEDFEDGYAQKRAA